MKRSTNNILLAVAFSASIHIVLGLTLLSDLSNKRVFTDRVNHLHLFWVALDMKKDAARTLEIARRTEALPGTVTQMAPMQETQRLEQVGQIAATIPEAAAQIAGATGLTAAATLTPSAGSPPTVSEQTRHASGNAKAETSGNRFADGETTDAYPLDRENAPPVYPEIARNRGYEGVVLVAMEILPDGRVGNIKIKKSSGYAILDRSALEAVKPWKFEPARKQGKPFASWRERRIKFVLHDDNLQS